MENIKKIIKENKYTSIGIVAFIFIAILLVATVYNTYHHVLEASIVLSIILQVLSPTLSDLIHHSIENPFWYVGLLKLRAVDKEYWYIVLLHVHTA